MEGAGGDWSTTYRALGAVRCPESVKATAAEAVVASFAVRVQLPLQQAYFAIGQEREWSGRQGWGPVRQGRFQGRHSCRRSHARDG